MSHPILKETASPLVSILIPLYNAEEYIGSLLEWCLRQPYKNIEVVVVDDHSTDHSLSIAKRYESDRIHVLTNPSKGAQSARNYAFAHSTGPFVKFHDADDYCSDTIISSQVERMLKDGDEDAIVFSSLHTIDVYGNEGNERHYNDHDYPNPIDYISDSLRLYSFHTPHCFLMNRGTVEKVGGWDEQVMIRQDNIFYTKAAEQASRMLYQENEYGLWRIHCDQNHMHDLSPEKARNSISTLCDIANTLLSHRDDAKSRKIAYDYIGQNIYRHFLSYRPILSYIDEVVKQNGLEWTKIKSPRLGFLYSILGWENATTLILQWRKFRIRIFHR